MSYGGGQKVQKVMVQPINLIFRFLQVSSHLHHTHSHLAGRKGEGDHITMMNLTLAV
jgi:hypothetical protein